MHGYIDQFRMWMHWVGSEAIAHLIIPPLEGKAEIKAIAVLDIQFSANVYLPYQVIVLIAVPEGRIACCDYCTNFLILGTPKLEIARHYEYCQNLGCVLLPFD